MHSPQTLKGIFALVVATFFFAAQDGITKHLTASLSAPQIVCIRFFFFSLFALLFAARRTSIKQALHSTLRGWQILRGLLIAGEIMVFALAIRHLGLAEMHTLFACFPLLVTALSPLLLGENVGWRRWLAVLVGFVGTLIILRPTTGIFDPYALLALSAALMFAVYNILTRKVAQHDSFETSLLYFGVVGFLGSLLLAPFYWQPLSTSVMLWLGLISSTAIIGHLLLIKSLELVPAVILQPFNYFVLVWAILLGYFIFGEVLDRISLLGALLVVASGVFIARREYRLLKEGSVSGQ